MTPEKLKHERKDRIIKFHRINHDVSIDSKQNNMSALIGEDRNGNGFYNLNNRTYIAENSPRGDHAIGEANEEFSINIIAHNSSNLNPPQTKYNKILNHIRNFKGVTMNKKEKGFFHFTPLP